MLEDAKLNYRIREAVAQVLSVAAVLTSDVTINREDRDAMADNVHNGIFDIIKEIYAASADSEWQSLMADSLLTEISGRQ